MEAMLDQDDLAGLDTASAANPYAEFTRPEQNGRCVEAAPRAYLGSQTAVLLSPYQAAWASRYRVEAEMLRTALAALSPRLEHIGSTAVPGMAARPVVDILLGVMDVKALDRCLDRLRNFGYHAAQWDGGRRGPQRLLIRQVRGIQTHRAFVVQTFGDLWHRALLVRDMLRLDADKAQRYQTLKAAFASSAPQHYEAGKRRYEAQMLGMGNR
jgi:GrpB-like predicted nucleotidyltransferase (UPF0157 family)